MHAAGLLTRKHAPHHASESQLPGDIRHFLRLCSSRVRGGLWHGNHAAWASLAVAAGLGLDPAQLVKKAPLGWGSDLWDLPRAGEQDGETEAQRGPRLFLKVTPGHEVPELFRIPQKSLRL